MRFEAALQPPKPYPRLSLLSLRAHPAAGEEARERAQQQQRGCSSSPKALSPTIIA